MKKVKKILDFTSEICYNIYVIKKRRKQSKKITEKNSKKVLTFGSIVWYNIYVRKKKENNTFTTSQNFY